MAVTMDKEILIRLPSELYRKVKFISSKEYKSISALIRELLREKVEATLSKKELAIIEKESKLFRSGKGIEWRKIRRG